MSFLSRIIDVFNCLRYRCRRARRGRGISLLVPFRSDHGVRAEIWHWLKQYYAHELPGAEIIVCDDDHDLSQSFCKTLAFNKAAQRATGDILVLLDADCYISGSVLLKGAALIRQFESEGCPLWLVPYRHFYRLNELVSADLLASNPRNPLRFYGKLDESVLDETSGVSHGHYFGALIQMVSRKAWDTVGGTDIRFRGWGSEDVCFKRALDTLYGQGKTLDAPVYHVWHPKITKSGSKHRMWARQENAHSNAKLAERYSKATRDPEKMRKLVDENPWLNQN